MLYKFKSKAAGDVIMLGPNGDELMRVLGREPAPKGIIEVAHMAQAIAHIEAAIQASAPAGDDEGADEKRRVSLRQRLWPMLEMLRRSQAGGEPIVWGV
jgi:hypothetical protein